MLPACENQAKPHRYPHSMGQLHAFISSQKVTASPAPQLLTHLGQSFWSRCPCVPMTAPVGPLASSVLLLMSPHRCNAQQSLVPFSRERAHTQPPLVAMMPRHHAPLLPWATAAPLATSPFGLGHQAFRVFVFLDEE